MLSAPDGPVAVATGSASNCDSLHRLTHGPHMISNRDHRVGVAERSCLADRPGQLNHCGPPRRPAVSGSPTGRRFFGGHLGVPRTRRALVMVVVAATVPLAVLALAVDWWRAALIIVVALEAGVAVLVLDIPRAGPPALAAPLTDARRRLDNVGTRTLAAVEDESAGYRRLDGESWRECGRDPSRRRGPFRPRSRSG